MKGLLIIAAFTTLSATSATLWASPSTNEQSSRLLLVGPVESVEKKTGTAIILGQKLPLDRLGSIIVGDAVSIYGTVRNDGTIDANKVVDKGPYVPGATPILLTGLIQQLRSSVGQAKIAGVQVELTSAYSADGTMGLDLGGLVQVSGTQPAIGGIVLANSVVGGGGIKANSVVGGGLQANSVVGGGGIKANSVVGGGLQANSVVGGGGIKANSVVGGGLQANSVVGGGGIKANSVVGGGLQANSVVGGGGIKANSVVGGGL